jgi:hypothetical protein
VNVGARRREAVHVVLVHNQDDATADFDRRRDISP